MPTKAITTTHSEGSPLPRLLPIIVSQSTTESEQNTKIEGQLPQPADIGQSSHVFRETKNLEGKANVLSLMMFGELACLYTPRYKSNIQTLNEFWVSSFSSFDYRTSNVSQNHFNLSRMGYVNGSAYHMIVIRRAIHALTVVERMSLHI